MTKQFNFVTNPATGLYDIFPMPLGKLTPPTLSGSYYPNNDNTPEYWMIRCPSCNSDNVCRLPKPDDCWLCISCQDSWYYDREELP